MSSKTGLLIFACFLNFSIGGFAKDIKKIIRAIDKGDLEKTLEFINTSLEDEWVNPGAKYFLAKHLAYDSLSFFDIDSARTVILQAINDLENASEDILEEFSKNDLSTDDLATLAMQIENQHWDRAVDVLQVQVFRRFLIDYPNSGFRGLAERKRDSLYWQEIRFNYDVREYEQFLDEYPRSYLHDMVEAAFDSLLYYSSIVKNQVEDYEEFLRRNPYSPYRFEAEKVILARTTLACRPEDFLDFAQKYWSPSLVKKAYDIHYYLTGSSVDSNPNLDSLRRVQNQGLDPFFVQMEQDTFYLTGANGDLLPNAKFDFVENTMLCGDNVSEITIGRKAENWTIQNRLGQIIYEGKYTGYQELGNGLILIQTGSQGIVLHKSGFTLSGGIDASTILDGRWIRISQGGKYGVISYVGHALLPAEYDDIRVSGDFVILEKDGKLAAINRMDFQSQIVEEEISLDFRFDDIEIVRDSMVIGFLGEQEALFDNQFNMLIPWGNYEIYPGVPFHYTRTDSTYQLYGDFRLEGQLIRANKLRESEGWMSLKTDSTWAIINKKKQEILASDLDSVSLVGDFMAVAFYKDSTKLFLSSDSTISLKDESTIAEIPYGENDSEYFEIVSGSNATVYNRAGEELFQDVHKEIRQLNDTLFAVTKGTRMGVIDADGKTVLRAYYELIEEDEGLLFLLRSGKIGAYALDSSRQFDVKYESRLKPFGDFYKTRIDGRYGLIDIDENEVLPFEYEDIRFWNDSVVWTQKEKLWTLQNIRTGELVVEEALRINIVFQNGEMKYATYFKGEGLGLIGGSGAVLLKPKFNEITNIGSDEEPIFLVELYSEEANYYVVFYLNKDGERIASNAYTPRQYERLICDD